MSAEKHEEQVWKECAVSTGERGNRDDEENVNK